jgi:hypothetical protein
METNIITVTNFVTLVTTNAQPSISGLDVIGNIKALYSSEFDKLFQLTLWILGFVGIALPILLPFYQKWLMRSELKSQLGKLLKNTKTELNTEIEKRFKEEEEHIEKRISKAEAKSYHLQGHRLFEKQRFAEACANFCQAADLFSRAESGDNLVRTIEFITEEILPNLKKGDLETNGLGIRLDNLLKLKASELNKDGMLSNLLEDFAEEYNKVKQG